MHKVIKIINYCFSVPKFLTFENQVMYNKAYYNSVQGYWSLPYYARYNIRFYDLECTSVLELESDRSR